MREHTAAVAQRNTLDDFWTVLVECHRDVPALLRTIAARVVDLIGDGCVLTTVTPDGTGLQPAAVMHRNPDVSDAMRAVLGADNMRIGEGIAGTVAADRRPVQLNRLAPETIAETTPARFLPFLRDHPMRSLMIVPLLAAGELVGTLGAIRTSSKEPYTEVDLGLLEALGERAALAIADALAAPRSIGAADYEAIYRHNLDGVLLTTPDGHILAANPAACAILQMTEAEITHRGRSAVVVAEDPRLAQALTDRAAVGHARSELMMRRGDGTTFVADVSSTIFTSEGGRARASVIFRDVSAEVAAREAVMARLAELEVAADRDPLTGLWNRRGFAVAAEHALAASDRDELVVQVVFVDVDALKSINDAEGHASGDAALITLASAIRRAIRDVDVPCRLGGDEFVILTVDTPAADVPLIVARIEEELAAGRHDSHPNLAFSTGFAERRPHTGTTLAELIAAADRDMYQQKVLRRLRRPD